MMLFSLYRCCQRKNNFHLLPIVRLYVACKRIFKIFKNGSESKFESVALYIAACW